MREEPVVGASESAIEELLSGLSVDQLRGVLRAAVERHEDVGREVRLLAARSSGDLAAVRVEVDRGLRTRRFLDYRDSFAFAQAARPIVAELEELSRSAPTRELVELLQRAIGHVVKVLHRADDSAGAIGQVAEDLLQAHAHACDVLVADPAKLAAWMVRFRFVEQDFFEADPVRYRQALGERGVAAYRRAVAAAGEPDSFAARYARERIAVLDGDLEAVVRLFGEDLSHPDQFVRVAEAMRELGHGDEVLRWALRGLAETSGWQTGKLYDLACATHADRGEPLEALRLRRAQHERSPSQSTYAMLRNAAEAVNAWGVERDAARLALRRHDLSGYVDALLSDRDKAAAWEAASAASAETIGAKQWLRLAEAREDDVPADAVRVYQHVVAQILERADRRAYQQAVRILKRAAKAATAAGEDAAFAAELAALRERYRRRPTLIELLDKAKLA